MKNHNCPSCQKGLEPVSLASAGPLTQVLAMPKRGPWEALEALGVRRNGVSTDCSTEIETPDGWSVHPSQVSPYHLHLLNPAGERVACIFLKTGASGTFQMRTEENCAD